MEEKKDPTSGSVINDKIQEKAFVEDEEVRDLNSLSTDQLAELISQRIRENRKLESQKGRAFVEGALSELSLGLTDQLQKKAGLATSRELRKRRETGFGIAGRVTGLGASLLTPGGIGKGATKAGKFVEKAVSKTLKEGAEGAAAKRMLKDVAAKAAGGATETVPFAAGQLVQEDALGTADFNADNLMASVGAGAFLGGGLGSIIGGAKALTPLAKNSGTAKQISGYLDPKTAAMELAGITTPAAKANFVTRFPKVADNVQNFLVNDLKIKTFTSAAQRAAANEDIIRNVGKRLGEVYTKADDFVASKNLAHTPTYKEFYENLVQKGDSLLEQATKVSASKEVIRNIRSLRKDFSKLAQKEGRLGFKDLHELKKAWGDRVDDFANPKDLMDDFLVQSWASARENIENSLGKLDSSDVEGALGGLLSQLRKDNLTYSTAKSLRKALRTSEMKADKFLGITDMVTSGAGSVLLGDPVAGITLAAAKKFVESDIRRSLVVQGAANKALQDATKKINGAMTNFAKGAKTAAAAASVKALSSSNFSNKLESGKTPKKPKDKKEAYNNLQENITRAVNDPDFLANRMLVTAGHIDRTMPKTGAAIKDRVMRAVQFLNSKLPVNQNQAKYPHMKREFEPSSFELAKFERYLQVIENPLSVMDELGSRSLTRDHVEALASVYPNLYERMRDKAMETASDPKVNLGYDQRIQLGILMEFDSDPSMEPMRVKDLQANFGQEQDVQADAEMREGAVKPTVGGLKEVQFAERQKTSRLGSLIRRQS